jgi:8-amino-3,8-dideoxy-alpha-D-manno-octulosonate transaminase
MDRIVEIARTRGVKVLEDCAQSCGASFRGRMVGSFGDINAFSLQFNKVITAGEGGVVVSDDDGLHERAVRAHDQGVVRPASGQILGLYQERAFLAENYRMSELAGAMARAQLRKLDSILTTLRGHARRIRAAAAEIEGLELRMIHGSGNNVDADGDVGFSVVFFLPEAEQARRFIAALNAENIGAYQIYGGDPVYAYPQVLHQRLAADRGGPFAHSEVRYRLGMCPRSEALLRRSVWISVGTQYSDVDTNDIISAIRKVHAALK